MKNMERKGSIRTAAAIGVKLLYDRIYRRRKFSHFEEPQSTF
jgi:hypothetical protein